MPERSFGRIELIYACSRRSFFTPFHKPLQIGLVALRLYVHAAIGLISHKSVNGTRLGCLLS